MSIATVLTEIIDRIVREFQPEKIIRFGPQARGNAFPYSDVELLVVMPEGTDRHATAVAILKLLGDLPVAKTVIVTTPDEISRRGQIVGSALRPALREGRVLYDRESEATHELWDWLRFAREDLHAATLVVQRSDVAPRQACWLAQQSAEKAIKSIFVFLQLDFPHVHDLTLLLTLVPDDWQLKHDPPDLSQLANWAVNTRYPAPNEPTTEDAIVAVQTASTVFETVTADLLQRGYSLDENEDI